MKVALLVFLPFPANPMMQREIGHPFANFYSPAKRHSPLVSDGSKPGDLCPTAAAIAQRNTVVHQSYHKYAMRHLQIDILLLRFARSAYRLIPEQAANFDEIYSRLASMGSIYPVMQRAANQALRELELETRAQLDNYTAIAHALVDQAAVLARIASDEPTAARLTRELSDAFENSTHTVPGILRTQLKKYGARVVDWFREETGHDLHIRKLCG